MKSLILISAFCFSSFVNSDSQASEAIGFYSKGKLLSAKSIFERGTPIHKLFISRGRLYTSDEMHDLLTASSEFIAGNFPDSNPLQVGDLSARAGGQAEGHASHQNGLDGDIVYLRRNHYVHSPKEERWDEFFVSGSKITANFNTERNFALFKYLVLTTPVERIFVDLTIKKDLCNYAKKKGMMSDPQTVETLRRLRPQDLHRTHFHVRISCPVNDRECIPQSAPPEGTGCDDLTIILESAEAIQTC
jgi:penicillin-insensitive murein endopeptidase